jgi:hypothetical protein
VGHPLFITKELAKYADELKECASKLIAYPDLQGRMLLFRWCFIPKPYHMVRTTSPVYSGGLVKEVETIKRSIVSSIVGMHDGDMIDDLTFDAVNFRIPEGGLGFNKFSDVQRAAYVASIVMYAQSAIGKANNVAEYLMQHVNLRHDLPLHWAEFFDALHSIPFTSKEVPELLTAVPNSTATAAADGDLEAFRLRACLGLVLGKIMRRGLSEGTMQNWLTELLAEQRMHVLKNVAYAPPQHRTKLTWLISLQCAEAGAWLDVKPNRQYNAFTNLEYRTALRHRLQLPADRMIEGLRCICKPAGNSEFGHVDPVGHHLATGCNCGNHRQQTHDGAADELNRILRYAGMSTQREERHVFDNAGQGTVSAKRPDISVLNSPEHLHTKLLLDVSVATPLLGSKKGVIYAPTPPDRVAGKVAEGRYNNKMARYGDLAAAKGFGFLPFVFESSGRMHPEASKYMKKIAKYASEVKRIPEGTLYNYFIKCLSMALQKGVAHAISDRLHLLTAHTGAVAGPVFRSAEVMDHATWR